MNSSSQKTCPRYASPCSPRAGTPTSRSIVLVDTVWTRWKTCNRTIVWARSESSIDVEALPQAVPGEHVSFQEPFERAGAPDPLLGVGPGLVERVRPCRHQGDHLLDVTSWPARTSTAISCAMAPRSSLTVRSASISSSARSRRVLAASPIRSGSASPPPARSRHRRGSGSTAERGDRRGGSGSERRPSWSPPRRAPSGPRAAPTSPRERWWSRAPPGAVRPCSPGGAADAGGAAVRIAEAERPAQHPGAQVELLHVRQDSTRSGRASHRPRGGT